MKLPIRHFRNTDYYRNIILFLALNVPLIFVLLLRNLRQVDFTALTWIYLFCVTMGYYVLALLIVTSLVFLLSFSLKRFANAFAGALLVLFVFYLLIDSQVYSITSLHINFFWLEWVINDYKGLGLPASTVPSTLLALLLVAVIEFGIFVGARRLARPKHLAVYFWLLALIALAAGQTIHIATYETNNMHITSLTPELPAYLPLTSHKTAVKYAGILQFGGDQAGIKTNELKGSLHYPLNEIRCNILKDQKPPNIVVIFLESWRADAMNEKITPNIFKFSQKSTVCRQHFSSGNSTVAGTFGFFYGLDPTYWTAVTSDNVLIDNPVLIDILEEYKYNFGIFAKSNFKRHKIKDAVFRGIDVHEDFAGKDIKDQDGDMTRQFIAFLKAQKADPRPFFGFTFYNSNHSPYQYPKEDSVFLPAKDQNLMFVTAETDPTNYFNDYRNATHYVDRLIGDVLDQIDSLGYMSNTIIIVTTDHGEEFNDNKANFWGHGSNFTRFQTMVPLVFYAPGMPPQQIEYATSHIDIVPTILEEFFHCINDTRDYSNGINLFAGKTISRPFVIGSYVNHAFVIGDNVYEIFPLYTKDYKLNNIKSKASPPSSQMLKTIMEEVGRFYQNEEQSRTAHASR